jgi:excisionase family DNA binding protein
MSIHSCGAGDGPRVSIRAVERRTYTVEEAGRLLGLSRNTAYARATDGTLPTIRFGRRLLVPKAALDRLLGGEATA